jgi:transcription initiation factor TFIIB
MEDLEAEAWSDFEQIRATCVPCAPKNVHEFFCACGGEKVIGPDNLPVCTSCGLIETMFIDESPEWTSGVSEAGVSKDPSRCGNLATDTELFSTAWGTGTVISTGYRTSYAARRMARINFHTSMNHKDRSLFHAYKDIDEAARDALHLPDKVIRDAKVMYRKFNNEKLTRGAVRLGIKANCVLYACKLANVPRTTKEVADAFGIPTKDLSRTSHQFRETILNTIQKSAPSITRPVDVVHRLLNSFEIAGELRMKCIKLCRVLENCVPLMAKTPNSVASVVILLVLKMPKPEVCAKCDISLPTLTKIEGLVKAYLEELCVSK